MKKNTKYKHINTDESRHIEICPVRRTPIQKTVRTVHLGVLMTVYSFSTQYKTE